MGERYPIDGAKDALWVATAVPAPACERLDGEIEVDVAIIGAGFTGLNAALALAEAGTSVAVLEAQYLGYGASGRSGGQVNLGLNLGPSALIEQFGGEAGERLSQFVSSVPDEVFKLIKRYGLDCDPVQNGWVQGAATPDHLKAQEDLARDYERFGGRFNVLDAEQVKEKSGAHGYHGGLFCPSAGSLHPLSYTRELARVAMEKGAHLFTECPVTKLSKTNGRWQLSSPDGQVTAEKVLICTNAYTDALIPGLKETVVPVRSLLIASEPLSANLRAKVMPNEVTFVDKRRLILYLRYDRNGRLCAGDHGPMRDRFALEDFNGVKQRVLEIFPDLAGVEWEFHWGGRVAMTRSKLPYLHEIDDGLVAGMGYNGRGVGMGSMMGRILADYVLGKGQDAVPFPVTAPKTFPLHRFHPLGVTAAVKWHGIMDRLELRRGASSADGA